MRRTRTISGAASAVASGMAAALLLSGCATPIEYGPLGGKPARFSYQETPNGDQRYTLRVVGMGAPDMATMQAMWDRRAQELCGHTKFTKSIFRAERGTVLYGSYGGAMGQPILEGFLDCRASPT